MHALCCCRKRKTNRGWCQRQKCKMHIFIIQYKVQTILIKWTIILQDDKPAEENKICSVCTCNAKSKTVHCIKLSLTKLFAKDEWTVLNKTGTQHDIVRYMI